MTDTNYKRNYTIDILRGIAAIAVLLGHAIQRGIGINGGNYFGNYIFKIIYTFHMPLFMILSGYTLQKFTKKYDCKLLIKKIRRLLIPTIIWSYLIWYVRNIHFVGIKEFIPFPNNFLEYTKMLISHPDYVIWFLYVLLIYNIIFIIQKKLIKDNEQTNIIITMLIYLILNLIPTQNYGINNIIKYYPIFSLGFYLKPEYIKKHGMIFILALLIPYTFMLIEYQETFLFNYFVYYLISLIAIAIIYQVAIRIKIKPLINILCLFGKYSLEIYLCQCLCLNIGIGNGALRVLSVFISASIISVVLSIIISHTTILKFILFGKTKKE